MNKIYKVIWSKVKHQYVVVSELAHSNGKQSRTSRSSIRSRIAALVVCGAIAAFGVLPMNSAFAATSYTEDSGESTTTAKTGATIIDNDVYWDWGTENHSTVYNINGQNGITVSQDGSKNIIIGLNPGKGISVSNDTGVSIELSNGEGLKFSSNKLAVDVGDGLTTTNANGEASALSVKTGAGLKIDTENDSVVAVNVKENSGLTADTTNGLAIKLDEGNVTDKNISGLTVTKDGLKVNAGDGLSTESGQLAVKLAKTGDNDNSGLTVDTNGLKINNGDTLKIENNTLDVNLANNSGLSTEDGLKLNVDESGFEIENGQLKNKAVMYDKGTENDLTVGKL